MVFPILGANTESAAYEIDNSLRFNRADNPRLSRTPSSAGNRKTFTLSTWIKFCNFTLGSGSQNIYESRPGATSYFLIVLTNTGNASGGNTIRINSSSSIGGATTNIGVDRFFRDPSAWYHLVFAFDTTQGTDSNRIKMYVNGEQAGLNSTYTTYPDQNEEFYWNNNNIMVVGGSSFSSSEDSDIYLAETYNIDGQQLDSSYFGETNDNGVWVPKKYTGSYGTNGFKLEYKQTGTSQNSSGIGADTSGNDNHFAVTSLAATDVTTDTPTNNFCTLSSVDNDGVVLSEGNCNFDTSSGSDEGVRGTIGVQNGKWYYECKITNSAGLSAGNIGYANPIMQLTEDPRGGECIVINGSSSINFYNNSSTLVELDASDGIGQNDIIGVALDLDSGTKTIQFYKNGSTISSAQTIASDLLNDFLLPCMFDDGGVNDVVGGFNFGNPAFSISSGNADANGYGNFEYAPPSGYYAICTKNLAEFG